MSMEIIISEVLKLSPLERVKLIQLIAESIALEEQQLTRKTKLTKEQLDELDNRMHLFKEGKMKTIPVSTVKKKLIKTLQS